MNSTEFYVCLMIVLLLCACSQRSGYEMFRQMGYLECLKNSPRPTEDCQYSPDFSKYQQEMRLRYSEDRD
jgi:hypothetical protein